MDVLLKWPERFKVADTWHRASFGLEVVCGVSLCEFRFQIQVLKSKVSDALRSTVLISGLIALT